MPDPLFGLNALGGSLWLRAKDGLAHPGHRIEVTGGSFDRLDVALASEASRGPLAYHALFDDFRESGWRDGSDSRASRLHARASWRGDESELDFPFGWAGTGLRGRGERDRFVGPLGDREWSGDRALVLGEVRRSARRAQQSCI